MMLLLAACRWWTCACATLHLALPSCECRAASWAALHHHACRQGRHPARVALLAPSHNRSCNRPWRCGPLACREDDFSNPDKGPNSDIIFEWGSLLDLDDGEGRLSPKRAWWDDNSGAGSSRAACPNICHLPACRADDGDKLDVDGLPANYTVEPDDDGAPGSLCR